MEAALGRPLRGNAPQLIAEFAGRAVSSQEVGKGPGHARHLASRLLREFQAQAANAGFEPAAQMEARLLGFGAEHRIAATDVGHDGVGAPAAIAQSYLMLFARPAAIA